MKKEWVKFKKWLTNYDLDTTANQSLKIWEKTGESIKFSEESSRIILELGNIELHELGEISRTVQCQSCLKHVPEGLVLCSCGMCLRPSEEQTQRIKTQFKVLIVLCYHARVNYSRGTRKVSRLSESS